MKSVKLVITILLVLGLAFSFIGCSLGGSIGLDKDGNLNIKDDDGEIKIGEAEWKKDKMFGLSAPKAKLDSYFASEDAASYLYSEMKEKDIEDYIEKIQDAGFVYNTLITDYSFTGTNIDGETISFLYDKESGSGSISSSIGEKPSEEDSGEGAVIGVTDKEWDSDRMGGLPDPGGKVTSYWSMDGDTNYDFEPMEDPMEYVEIIKEHGYTVDPSEVEFNDTYMYSAFNDDGDKVSFTSSDELTSVTFEKSDS